MRTRIKALLAALGMAGALAQSACATTQETVQQCRQSAYAFCDRTVGVKDATAGGAGAASAAARNEAYQQCLDAQLLACDAP